MSGERWERVTDLFHAAESRPSAERAEYLRSACGSDDELRREVESLLEHHKGVDGFLQESALGASFSVSSAESMSAANPLRGRQVGPYRLEEQIGAGGMGTVHRAERADGLLSQTVAVKLMHPWKCSPDLVVRFQREWQTLANLDHPNIAKLMDAGLTEDGIPYLIMEHIAGLPIDEYCDDNNLSVAERLELFEVVARAVQFAHQRLVVHRDLKPANILVTTAGIPKLLDFGIAKVLDAGDDTPAAHTLTQMMTPAYASPEQLRGEPTTTAADVYSLGVLLYEQLCGRRPYSVATTSAATIESILGDRDPPRPSTAITSPPTDSPRIALATAEEIASQRQTSSVKLTRLLRGDLDNIVLMAMRRDPGRRYGSAERFADDIRRHLEGRPVTARPDTMGYRARKFVGRNRLASAAATLAVMAVLVGMTATAWQARRASAEAVHARIEAHSAQRIADLLTDAFLFSAPRRTAEEMVGIRGLLERHVVSARHEFAKQHHLRANVLDALGMVHLRVGMFGEAEELIGEAAAIRDREFGSGTLESALSLGSRGELAYQRGDLATARALFESALTLHRTLPRGVHSDVAKAANDLAVVLRQLGDIEAAVGLHREALAIRRREHGDRHPLVAASLNNLGAIHLQQREYVDAEEVLKVALEIRRESLGENHPLVAQTINNLATVAYGLGRPEDSETYLREAVARYRAIPGTDQDGLARTLSNLADLLRALGKNEEAHPLAVEALELHRQHLETDEHPRIAFALQVLASIESDLGDHDAAAEHYDAVLRSVRKLYPAGHPRIGVTLCNYASALLDRGDPSSAERTYRESLELLENAEPGQPEFLAAARFGLGSSLLAQRRFADAEPLLLSAKDRFEELESDFVSRCRDRLRRLYLEWGRPEQAAGYGPR